MKRTLQREISGENVSKISTRADCQEKNGARQEHQVPLSTLGYWIRKQTRKPFINEQKTAALADVRVRQHGFCEWISGLDDSFSRRLARSLNLGICYAVKPSPINTCISQLIPE